MFTNYIFHYFTFFRSFHILYLSLTKLQSSHMKLIYCQYNSICNAYHVLCNTICSFVCFNIALCAISVCNYIISGHNIYMDLYIRDCPVCCIVLNLTYL